MEQPEPAPTPDRRPLPGPPISADNAREMQARSAAAQRARREQARQDRADLADLRRQAERLERLLGETRADLATARADAKAARAEAAALRKRLEAAAARPAKSTTATSSPAADPAEALETGLLGAVRTLRSLLAALATAARAGDLLRSGADAAALVDAVVRAAAALQALGAATPGRSARPAAGVPGGSIGKGSAVELAGVADALRARLSLPTGSTTRANGGPQGDGADN